MKKTFRPKTSYYLVWIIPFVVFLMAVYASIYLVRDWYFLVWTGFIILFYLLMILRLTRIEIDGEMLRMRPKFWFVIFRIPADINILLIYRIDRLIQSDTALENAWWRLPLLNFYVHKRYDSSPHDNFTFWINYKWCLNRDQLKEILQTLLEINPNIQLADGLDRFLKIG